MKYLITRRKLLNLKSTTTTQGDVADKHPVSANRYEQACRKRHTLAMAGRCSRLQEFFLRVRTLAGLCQVIGCPRPRKLHLFLGAVKVLYYILKHNRNYY